MSICNCIEEINTLLADRNSKLATTIRFGSKPGEPSVLVTIQCDKINTRAKGRPPAIVPSFCPFCGISFAPSSPAGEG